MMEQTYSRKNNLRRNEKNTILHKYSSADRFSKDYKYVKYHKYGTETTSKYKWSANNKKTPTGRVERHNRTKFHNKNIFIKKLKARADRFGMCQPRLKKRNETSDPEDKKISFDNTCSIPTTWNTFIKYDAEGSMVVRFLQDFFTVYDSDNRENLESAYRFSALLSMSAVGSFSSMANYIGQSRNLKRVAHDKTDKLLFKGRKEILEFLKNLPKTRHDLHSFTLDVPMITPQLMSFTVTGMFKEIEDKAVRIKHFSRTFVVVPYEGSFQIINEMLFITPARAVNAKKAFPISSEVTSEASSSTKDKTSSTSVTSSLVTPIPSSSIQPSSLSSDLTKVELVRSLIATTGMNLEWSAKCLIENNWDFNRAAAIFTKLKNAQEIPKEAFVPDEHLAELFDKINIV